MSNGFDSYTGLTKATLGVQVSRAAASLPASTAAAVFTITGGRVFVPLIVGEVTTVIETQANATKLQMNPTAGTTADLCAALDITADEVGTLYTITGLRTDAMLGNNAGGAPAQLRGIVLPVGDIELVCAATNTGAIKWDLWYVPLDIRARVAAA